MGKSEYSLPIKCLSCRLRHCSCRKDSCMKSYEKSKSRRKRITLPKSNSIYRFLKLSVKKHSDHLTAISSQQRFHRSMLQASSESVTFSTRTIKTQLKQSITTAVRCGSTLTTRMRTQASH